MLTSDFSCVLDVRGRLQNQNYWIDDLQKDCGGEDGDVGSHWIFLESLIILVLLESEHGKIIQKQQAGNFVSDNERELSDF